jgi:3-hydroxyacyl-CoA dehydrogenase/enoyl-CoA hydratase/3-hydroxybutyryl-CoA epimerase
VEKIEVKRTVIGDLERIVRPECVIASNTSSLSVTKMQQGMKHPGRIAGMHFFNPVHRMPLVEVIRGAETSDDAVATVFALGKQLGKTPIVVNDSRGFYTSRTFGTFVREGACMVEEGIPATVIENAARQAGMPVGPLAVIDETSMSLSVHVMQQTRSDMAAEGKTYVPQPGEALFERMVSEFKRPGRAGGGGFYDYPAGGKKVLWSGLKQFEKEGVTYDLEELKQRFLYRQAIETARCLEEGVLTTSHDANIGSIFGIGFPTWTGGALQYINSEGVADFVKNADALAAKFGERFKVPQIVRDRASRGEGF